MPRRARARAAVCAFLTTLRRAGVDPGARGRGRRRSADGDHCDLEPREPVPPGRDFGPKTDAVYDAMLDRLARAIAAIGPDVLAVEEVGDPEALGDLVDRLDRDWHVDTSSVFEERHPIRVGFLSRVEITDAHDIGAFAPGLAAVKVQDDGTTIDAMPRGARGSASTARTATSWPAI
jgi:hypothetical protein